VTVRPSYAAAGWDAAVRPLGGPPRAGEGEGPPRRRAFSLASLASTQTETHEGRLFVRLGLRRAGYEGRGIHDHVAARGWLRRSGACWQGKRGCRCADRGEREHKPLQAGLLDRSPVRRRLVAKRSVRPPRSGSSWRPACWSVRRSPRHRAATSSPRASAVRSSTRSTAWTKRHASVAIMMPPAVGHPRGAGEPARRVSHVSDDGRKFRAADHVTDFPFRGGSDTSRSPRLRAAPAALHGRATHAPSAHVRGAPIRPHPRCRRPSVGSWPRLERLDNARAPRRPTRPGWWLHRCRPLPPAPGTPHLWSLDAEAALGRAGAGQAARCEGPSRAA
jgi:hypothetical protein